MQWTLECRAPLPALLSVVPKCQVSQDGGEGYSFSSSDPCIYIQSLGSPDIEEVEKENRRNKDLTRSGLSLDSGRTFSLTYLTGEGHVA